MTYCINKRECGSRLHLEDSGKGLYLRLQYGLFLFGTDFALQSRGKGGGGG